MSTKAILASETPQSALQKLIEGNIRFRMHEHTQRDFMQEMEDTIEEQFPFAIILGCIDSRVPVEILFDQGIGDLFVTRTAGNILTPEIVGGMEFACAVVGSKLILVLGHENCGAVKAACDNVDLGHIKLLVDKIKPSINPISLNLESQIFDKESINEVSKRNVNKVIDEIREKSEILRKLENENKIAIVGAFYHLHSGVVEILNN